MNLFSVLGILVLIAIAVAVISLCAAGTVWAIMMIKELLEDGTP